MAESAPGSDALPLPLARLLHANSQPATESAWQAFVSAYSPLLLQVARSVVTGHDGAMDAYTFLLEALRENQCRRLRVYVAHDQARFSTWLLVVARRLCIDYHRRRYGRPQGASDEDAAALERATRRRLVDLAAEEIDVDSLTDVRADSPDSRVRSAQLRQALETALEALPPADRLLLVMRFEDGRSAAAIARAMGLPTPFHVYRRLSHVLARLRASLAERGVHDPIP